MGYVLLLVAQLVLLYLSVLRETQDFWLNAGGYPEWLRSLVQAGYYPYLGLLSALHWGLPPWRRKLKAFYYLIWVASTLLWTLSLLWILCNNGENLIQGRPLHWHPDQG